MKQHQRAWVSGGSLATVKSFQAVAGIFSKPRKAERLKISGQRGRESKAHLIPASGYWPRAQ
ncbi:MAG: hypothetical protein NC112_05075 [Oxalobacter formigenes]|nr:hypothetical protein [Oxalobacter formigenes]